MSQAESNNNHGGKKLGWFLCWAVVFADIGTSLYYVPGILFGEVGNLAGLFVVLTSLVFVLLVLKYIEITDRYPEGGGVVTVATHAFGPWFGVIGGMFIIVDYFLTASISSVSGFAYLNSIMPLGEMILWGAVIGVTCLGILNIVGIKESAGVTAVVATAAFIVDAILLFVVASQVKPEGWTLVFQSLGEFSKLSPWTMLTGYAGAFLAFSGLESISQLSPAMETPRKKVASIAMILVVIAVFTTSPLLTLFSTNLLDAKIGKNNETILQTVQNVKPREKELALATTDEQKQELTTQIKEGKDYSERFISELGAQFGGSFIKIAIVLTASILLLFASNTAIIGAYHVFIALSRNKFLPSFMTTYNKKFGTPHWSVLCAVLPPIVIMIATHGDVGFLGELYAFGLLGAFGLSSIGLDVVRWNESKKLSPMFIIGVITSLLVAIAWVTNLIYKTKATIFGGAITIIGIIIAYFTYKYRSKEKSTLEENAVSDEVKEEQKLNIPADQVFLPVFDEFDASLFEYAAEYAEKKSKELIIMYIREFSDVYQTVTENIELDNEANKFLGKAKKILAKYPVKYHELYEATNDTGDTINKIRSEIHPEVTILTPHRQSAILDFLKGNITETVLSHKNGNVLIYTGKN